MNDVVEIILKQETVSIETVVQSLEISIEGTPPQIEVSLQETGILEIGVPGLQGPPGAAGSGYIHTQTALSSVWTISHNLGLYPSVATFTYGGVEIRGDVQHLSVNVTRITFNIPTSGYARLA